MNRILDPVQSGVSNKAYNKNIINNKKYSITISPPARLAMDPKVLYLRYKEMIESAFYNSCTYQLYPEFDETHRLHFHGVYQIKDVIKFSKTKHVLHKIGFTKIKELKTFQDNLRWIIYCQKEWGKSSQILRLCNPLSNLYKDRRTKVERRNLVSPSLDFYFTERQTRIIA